MLPLQRGRQGGATTHGVTDVGDGTARFVVFRQFQQDGQGAVQGLPGAEQRRQLLGELHQPLAGEGLGLEQRA